jgi:hypothetical protein
MKSINYKTTSFNTSPEQLTFPEYENYQYQPSNIRVISKKILYLIGIPYEIANEETLIKKEYLGQYGSIHKIIVNKNGYMKNESNSPTYSSYITYSNEVEASLALLTLNNSTLFDHKLNACYGTNKYCNSFLKGVECNNKDCFYLHEYANKNDIIMKNDTQMKMQFIEQQKIATNIANIFSPEQKKIYLAKGLEVKNEFKKNNIKNYFPTIDTIYDKKFIQDIENEKEMNSDEIYITHSNSNRKFNKDNYFKPSSPNSSYSKKNKNNEFNSPDLQRYDNMNEMDDENEEYILVRQPSRHKKRYGGNKNAYKRNYYKKNNFKLKFTLEKYKLKYNIKEEDRFNNNDNLLDEYIEDKNELDKSINENYNTNSNSNYNTNESSSQNNQQDEIEVKKHFYKRTKSRFSFANSDLDSNENKNSFVVPDFVNDILNKAFYSLCFNNMIRKYQSEPTKRNFMEDFLLEEEIKVINKWAINN